MKSDHPRMIVYEPPKVHERTEDLLRAQPQSIFIVHQNGCRGGCQAVAML